LRNPPRFLPEGTSVVRKVHTRYLRDEFSPFVHAEGVEDNLFEAWVLMRTTRPNHAAPRTRNAWTRTSRHGSALALPGGHALHWPLPGYGKDGRTAPGSPTVPPVQNAVNRRGAARALSLRSPAAVANWNRRAAAHSSSCWSRLEHGGNLPDRRGVDAPEARSAEPGRGRRVFGLSAGPTCARPPARRVRPPRPRGLPPTGAGGHRRSPRLQPEIVRMSSPPARPGRRGPQRRRRGRPDTEPGPEQRDRPPNDQSAEPLHDGHAVLGPRAP